jgi:hypothetical protein
LYEVAVAEIEQMTVCVLAAYRGPSGLSILLDKPLFLAYE